MKQVWSYGVTAEMFRKGVFPLNVPDEYDFLKVEINDSEDVFYKFEIFILAHNSQKKGDANLASQEFCILDVGDQVEDKMEFVSNVVAKRNTMVSFFKKVRRLSPRYSRSYFLVRSKQKGGGVC